MASLKVEQGHFETAILILHNFFVFFYGYRFLGSIALDIFMIQALCAVMQLFKGSYFSVDAASRHFWPDSAIANGALQGTVLKNIYFQSSSKETIFDS